MSIILVRNKPIPAGCRWNILLSEKNVLYKQCSSSYQHSGIEWNGSDDPFVCIIEVNNTKRPTAKMYIHELWHWTAVEPTTMRVISLWTSYCRQSSSTPAKTKINMQIAVWGWSVLRSTPIIPSFTRVSSHALYFRNSRQTFLICVYTILNGNNCKRKCVMWFLCMEYIIFVSNGWKDVRRAKPWYTYTSILFAVLMVILIFFSSSSFFFCWFVLCASQTRLFRWLQCGTTHDMQHHHFAWWWSSIVA